MRASPCGQETPPSLALPCIRTRSTTGELDGIAAPGQVIWKGQNRRARVKQNEGLALPPTDAGDSNQTTEWRMARQISIPAWIGWTPERGWPGEDRTHEGQQWLSRVRLFDRSLSLSPAGTHPLDRRRLRGKNVQFNYCPDASPQSLITSIPHQLAVGGTARPRKRPRQTTPTSVRHDLAVCCGARGL